MKYTLTLWLVMFALDFGLVAEAGPLKPHQARQVHLTKPGHPAKAPGTITLALSLPGALTLDITLDFEAVTDLSLLTAGMSAALVSTLDAGLVARLPDGVISIPSEFPVLVHVEPPAIGLTTLAFDGIVTVTLLTPDLPYYPGTRLRLLTAHDGGDFKDITREVSKGSYRVRGSGGEFSEFLIVLDERDPETIVDTKLDALQSLLSGHAGVIDGTVFAQLQTLLDATDLNWQKRNVIGAIAELDLFAAAVVASAPAEIPDSWAATGGPDNVAGMLRASAATLRFSLNSTVSHVRYH